MLEKLPSWLSRADLVVAFALTLLVAVGGVTALVSAGSNDDQYVAASNDTASNDTAGDVQDPTNSASGDADGEGDLGESDQTDDPGTSSSSSESSDPTTVLNEAVANDAPSVDEMEGGWSAQIASSAPGEDPEAFLEKYQGLQAQYSNVELGWSSDWPGTYGPSSADLWVVLVGPPDPYSQSAVSWCGDQGFEKTSCWAVRLSKSGDPTLNIDHYPADSRNN